MKLDSSEDEVELGWTMGGQHNLLANSGIRTIALDISVRLADVFDSISALFIIQDCLHFDKTAFA